MNRNEWQKISEIVSGALDLPPAERRAHVHASCRGNLDLQREVEELLAAEESEGVLEAGSVFALASFSGEPDQADLRGFGGGDVFKMSLIGKILDERYEITGQIGEGGMGYVFQARDLRLTNRPVVVKFIKPEILQEEYLLKKFQQETEALARIKAEGVIDIYDTGKFSGVPYLVTEYFPGQNLDAWLRDAPLSFQTAAEIFKKIGRALTAAHQVGIIHRDLKPSNILVRETGGEIAVKLIDFGIARIHDPAVSAHTTQFGRTLGTAHYMSPEQLYGEANLTPASDVFSFAVIAYEMLVRKRPFNPQSIAQLPEMHRRGVEIAPRRVRPEIPARAEAAVLKALNFEPGARFQTAAEFGDELARGLSEAPFRTTDGLSNAPTEPISGDVFKTPSGAAGAVTLDRRETERAETAAPRKSSVAKYLLIGGATLAALLVAVIVGWQFVGQSPAPAENRPAAPGNVAQPTPENPVQAAAERSFSYALNVQPTEKNRPAFVASPLQTFLGGWRFRMRFQSAQHGYLYLLSEGLNESGAPVLSILFPDPRLNGGQARIKADQLIETNQYEFAKTPGVEKFWIVWSASAVPEFEAVKNYVNPRDLGVIGDAVRLRAAREFLQKAVIAPSSVAEDEQKQRIVVSGAGEVVVHLAEFRHN